MAAAHGNDAHPPPAAVASSLTCSGARRSVSLIFGPRVGAHARGDVRTLRRGRRVKEPSVSKKGEKSVRLKNISRRHRREDRMLSASAAAVGRVAHHIGAGCRRSGTRSAPRAYARGGRASREALGAWRVAARRGGSVGDCQWWRVWYLL